MANIKKNAAGYGYRYTDLAAINDYIESIGESYYQETETVNDVDYVITVRLDKDGKEIRRIRGCRVIQASLGGNTNPAQEQGSGLTYARRYSILMAYGLATEDDDGESLTQKPQATKVVRNRQEEASQGPEPMGKQKTVLEQAKLDIGEELKRQGYNRPDTMLAFINDVLGKDKIESIDEATLVANALDDNNLTGNKDE